MNTPSFKRIFATIAIIWASLLALTHLLTPKYDIGIIEGAFVAEYYDEQDKDHDLIIIGDCEAYGNFSPPLLWREYGISSYIRGSAQQLVWQSYYLLEDTLYNEKPKVVIFNVLALMYNKPQSEAYNRMSIEGMRWTPAKANNINASMTPQEQFMDYVFPLLRYHSRWSELTASDFTHMWGREKVTHNGYYMNVGVVPIDPANVPKGKILADYSFGDTAMEYMDKITALCAENDIELILIKAPSLYPYWYEQWEEQVVAYAAANNLRYVNLLARADEIGLDYATDTYDGGLHLNLAGTEKLTRYLGEYLLRETPLYDRRGDERLAALWAEKLAYYDAEAERLYAEK
jgi:hypothetical protein